MKDVASMCYSLKDFTDICVYFSYDNDKTYNNKSIHIYDSWDFLKQQTSLLDRVAIHTIRTDVFCHIISRGGNLQRVDEITFIQP